MDKMSLYYGMDDPPHFKHSKTQKREDDKELRANEIVNSKLNIKGEKNK